ncbi:MAG: hypothetical protein CVT48_05925 [Thermoplasmata archaeon HGW-Thermoplasmata-1]|nr:MAG: hypothetical protein CVT48_05925 [Thermoplasmata archaeon HGW-Thermoplasmata-1]
MARFRPRDKKRQRGIAEERIDRLFQLAKAAALAGRIDRAGRYMALARKMAMKIQKPLPPEMRRAVCRRCGAFMLPGSTCRTRVGGSRVTTTCLGCGEIYRFPFLREQKTGTRRYKKTSLQPSDVIE